MLTDLKEATLLRAFGNVVKRRREKLGLTQQELAERGNLHRTYLSDIERGSRNFSFHSLELVAAALQIPVSLLFAEAETDLFEVRGGKTLQVN